MLLRPDNLSREAGVDLLSEEKRLSQAAICMPDGISIDG